MAEENIHHGDAEARRKAWDEPCRAELATDLETREAVKLAQFSYETTYHRAGKWPDLNPMVRQHWIEITLATMKALRLLAGKPSTTKDTKEHGGKAR